MTRLVSTAITLVAAAALLAPAALAHGKPVDPGKPAGKGKPSATGVACKPAVSVILHGTVSAVDAAARTVTFTVERANRHGRSLVTKSLVVAAAETTTIRRDGPATLTEIVATDHVRVHLRSCKAELAALASATTPPTAKKIIAKAAPATVPPAPPAPPAP